MLRTPPRDEREVRLPDLVDEGVREINYLYDFGDDWSHTIQIEGVEEADPRRLPELLDGERLGPPEDSGGLPGYEEIQSVFAGGATEDEAAETAAWVGMKMGSSWTPESLDAAVIQDRLSRTWRGPRK